MNSLKTTLYLIPGTMCNQRLWSLMLPALTEHFEVFYLSPPMGDNLDAMVQNIIINLPDEPVYMVGFSLGGYLASMLAIQYPDRVKKLFIIANSSGVLPNSEISQRQQAVEFVNKHGYGGMSRRKAASLIDAKHINTDEIVAVIRQMDQDLDESVFLNQMHATTHRPDLHEGFHCLHIPTTFYYSQNDRLVDKEWLNHCCAENASFDQITEQGSGHMLPLERPDQLLKNLIKWL